MARKRKTVPVETPAPIHDAVGEGYARVRVVFTGPHILDGESIPVGAERSLDASVAEDLIARRCARMA